MAKKFKMLRRKGHIRSIKLAEYATPYPKNSKEERRKIPEEPCKFRNAFIRDRDRIVHSKSFRKLQDKTQIYISELSPIVRNRLTHTLEVWQIAVSIARMLRANIHLVEAIAFGHDLGHTPFGHAGEWELDRIMKDKDLDGFSHNEQSVRLVSLLEDPPSITPIDSRQKNPSQQEPIGLNLTHATREGLFKHTGRFKKCKDKKLCNEFGTSCGTLEAQIVHISDDIAQHTHDLHDIWMAGVIGSVEIYSIKSDYPKFFGSRNFVGTKADISPIIGNLIFDVADTSINILNDKYEGDPTKHKFIRYSKEGKEFSDELEKLIREYAINGDEVNQMNSRGRHMIRSLFEFCIEDPYCLPKDIKSKFQDDIRQQLNNTKEYKKIDFNDSDDIRVICDYIASLTDKEAISMFHSTLI